MTSKQLPPDAETLRGQIKSMIPEARENGEAPLQTATVLSEDSEGNKEYIGETLGQKVSALVKQLQIGLGWGWTLSYFTKPRGIKNELKQMYLIPLSRSAIITPGGPLREGWYTYIEDQPVLSSNTAVIFISRR